MMDAIPVKNVVFAQLGTLVIEEGDGEEGVLFLGGVAVHPYDGMDHVGHIAKVMAQGVTYIGIPVPQGGEPDHFLDIDVTACSGGLAFVVNLPPKDDQGFQLLFDAQTPFSLRPDTFAPNEKVIVQQSTGPDRTWASITLDLGAIASSAIGKAVKSKGFGWMGVPYSMNVIESAFGFSPVMLPHHATDLKIGASAQFVPPGSATPNLLGHGGPHPPGASYLIAAV